MKKGFTNLLLRYAQLQDVIPKDTRILRRFNFVKSVIFDLNVMKRGIIRE